MDEQDKRLLDAIEQTQVVRPPKQSLATFGSTSVRYYLVASPVYRELNIPAGAQEAEESVVREGTVRADQPRVVTPHYLLNIEGFGENAERYLQRLINEFGPNEPGLMYHYKNEGSDTSIVSGAVGEVVQRIIMRLEKDADPLSAVIQGSDDLWDVSLMKFIYELTSSSARRNASELRAQGLLEMEGTVPRDGRQRIEWMLEQARRGAIEPAEAHREMNRWGVFDEYQDRFLKLFK